MALKMEMTLTCVHTCIETRRMKYSTPNRKIIVILLCAYH